MPFLEVVGRAAIVAPEQYGRNSSECWCYIGVNGDSYCGSCSTQSGCRSEGIKVVVVLFIAGLHVPVMPFLDVVGRAEIVAPEQYGPTAANVGVTLGLTVIVIVAVVAHSPAVGVNV